MRKPIKGYEGLYEISDQGHVFSLARVNRSGKRIPEIHMKPAISEKGYVKVNLRRDGKMKRYGIHRLVAETFIKKDPNLHEVNHIDGDKTNNAVSNLEWSNRSLNMLHAIHVLKIELAMHKRFKQESFY